MPISTEETVKDNQWWFGKSELRSEVENSRCIALSINGRSCILERSAVGRDGRDTLSFRFIRDDDRAYWRSLNGTLASIEVVDTKVSPTDVDEDEENEYLSPDTSTDGRHRTLIMSEHETSNNLLTYTRNGSLLFDAYIFVDWSANNSPKTGKDSIWIAEGSWENNQFAYGPENSRCINFSTRESATQHIKGRLREHVEKKQNRVLICFDFPYAYPICSESQTIGGTFKDIWLKLRNLIQDDNRNRSNRFQVASNLNEQINPASIQGPFWGRPVNGNAADLRRLESTRYHDLPRDTLQMFRIVEERMKRCGKRPFSVWQLFGNGSVGSQTLLGLPRLYDLTHDKDLVLHSAVWPFETENWGLSFKKCPLIVHAEFWPGAIEVDPSLHDVKDASQVLSYLAWAAKNDNEGTLEGYFNPLKPTDPERDRAKKEGWILGFRE